ncbi:DUF6402 family protein [Paracidovorax avenae]|uniref:DUF6402 family protein n=1 Tax=Paracidovorax avenae TaxID=80867 RepID=UPI000D214ADD|nr:DUF6402 family protein [Paracidovorax avenae]AVT14550.1 hypothetical protein C8235_03655 [Paracidovorax avenae]
MVDLMKAPQEALQAVLGRSNKPKYATPLFQLRDIPSVMRSRLGWPVAAALMERWFNGAAFAMPQEMKEGREFYRLRNLNSSHLDETTVTMAWAMRFSRVQAAIDKLQSDWSSPAGLLLLKQRITTQMQGRLHQCWRFGDLGKPAKIIDDTCQVNYLVFGKLSDPMDDFYGAMGEAQLKAAVSGFVTPEGPGKWFIEVDELGLYLRDAYDFNDSNSLISQPLGCWGFNGVECGISTRWNVEVDDVIVDEEPESVQKRKYIVQNSDFQRWRKLHHRGGDFIVLSDVLRIPLQFPKKFSF